MSVFLVQCNLPTDNSRTSDVTSDQSMIILNIYDRRHDPEHCFLGTLQIKPVLLHDHTVDNWYKCVCIPDHRSALLIMLIRLRPFENEVVTGEIRIQVTYEQLQVCISCLPILAKVKKRSDYSRSIPLLRVILSFSSSSEGELSVVSSRFGKETQSVSMP